MSKGFEGVLLNRNFGSFEVVPSFSLRALSELRTGKQLLLREARAAHAAVRSAAARTARDIRPALRAAAHGGAHERAAPGAQVLGLACWACTEAHARPRQRHTGPRATRKADRPAHADSFGQAQGRSWEQPKVARRAHPRRQRI